MIVRAVLACFPRRYAAASSMIDRVVSVARLADGRLLAASAA
jgi:hypothetical protein